MQRSLALVFLLAGATLLGAGCLQPKADEGSGGGGNGGGGASSECDGKDDCNACSQCAAQLACAAQLSACFNDASCQAIDQCFSICGVDAECKQQCYVSNPGGVNAYEAATRCLYCNECASDCAGFRSC